MSSILDSREEICELDKSNVLGSVEQLQEQIKHVWKTVKETPIVIPAQYKNCANVVVNGMGGSALGARVIKTLYKDQLPIPLEIINHYELPAYVNEKSLVVLSSYSGSTEETLAAAEDAKRRGAKIAVIAAGGKLLEFAQTNGYPFYQIVPTHNPSNQPRMAIGYSVFGQLALLHQIGLLSISDEEVENVYQLLQKNAEQLKPESVDNNTAKFLAFSAVDKMIALVSAEHLEGAVHVFNNQLNENAKNLTMDMVVPELNHHYMEALSFPDHSSQDVIFYFFYSGLYHDRVQKRFPLTRDIVERKGFPAETIMAVSKTKLEQVWEIIQLGAFTNLYLAMLNGIDPAPIPTVDEFKEKLR